MKYCEHCGSPCEDNTRFCSNCGAKFPDPAPEPAPAPVPDTTYQSTYESAYQPTYQSAAPSYDQTLYKPVMMNGEVPTMSGLAIAGFVVSIVSIFCCGFTAIIGLILSIAGLISASKKSKKGLGFAIAGLIISGLLTLLIVAEVVVCWGAIKTAAENTTDGDIQEFFDILEDELEKMEEEGYYDYNNGDDEMMTSLEDDWNDIEVSSDYEYITIEYTDGIPDDFEFYDATFEDICDELEDNFVITDSFGMQHRFDTETFRRLVSMQFVSPDEYERMDLTRSQTVSTLSYLAVLSFEMSNDNFCPDRAVYLSDSNSYEYYGELDPHNIGRSVIVFTDGTNQVNFDEAMCGDEICWAYDFADPEVYRLGMDADSLEEYPAGGFLNTAEWVASMIDPLV